MIKAVSPTENKPLLTASNTGYTALAGMGLTTLAGICKNNNVRKYHKPLGYITAGLTLTHLGIILHNRNEWKKTSEEKQERKKGAENK